MMMILDKSPAIFMAQTKERIVQARTKWKVPNRYVASINYNWGLPYNEAAIKSKEEMTELEVMYYEFCEKAHDYLISHPTLVGENHPHKIIFPDFIYEIIPKKFAVE